MLNRRLLRIKVLQSLYAFFQSDSDDLGKAEQELFKSIELVYSLYIYLLLLCDEIINADRIDYEDASTKYFPTAEERNLDKRLFNSEFGKAIANNLRLKDTAKNRILTWQKDNELVRKLFLSIKRSETYQGYLKNAKMSEKDFVLQLLAQHLLENELVRSHIEEQNITWLDDFDFVCAIVYKQLQLFYQQKTLDLFELYKDAEDDKKFVKELFAKTILKSTEYDEIIAEKIKNWDMERLAVMDNLILKMAIAELINFENIPIKVTINEYIDISKDFSTPRSKQFINGVIDKIAIEFKANGKIVKTGRGLKEA
ncbi:MAG: hypothetical protein RIQ89_945 [Bacteroidota bacterium]|jgi:N utilization substance protein B